MKLNRYNPEYQKIILNTILNALRDHSRLTVIRCDLRFPLLEIQAEMDSRVITRFFESLKAKISADIKRKEKSWGRSLSCVLSYVWVREYGDINGRKHYHVLLFLNKDVYYSLGDYSATSGNLAAMIKQAWCSATGLTHLDFMSLVNFGKIHYLDKNSSEHENQIDFLLKYADYLAKNVTKHYGDGERSIGSSS